MLSIFSYLASLQVHFDTVNVNFLNFLTQKVFQNSLEFYSDETQELENGLELETSTKM